MTKQSIAAEPLGNVATGLFHEVVRRGLVSVREDLERLEAQIAGVTRIEVDAIERPKPARTLGRNTRRRPARTTTRKALPAPRTAQKTTERKGNAKPSPLRDAVAEILGRKGTALTCCEIAERLRSRAFAYDPGKVTDTKLKYRVQTCLQQNKTTLFEHSEKGVGWLLRKAPGREEVLGR